MYRKLCIRRQYAQPLGTQAPFTDITLDWTVPADLADLPCIVGGKPMDFTYGDCKAEMDMINRAFIEVMIEGDANGRGFQYPIPIYSICADHGYLAGEQTTCPHCGRKTEVYSRITGYYRPVQNWNDGKSQEFMDRKTYRIGKIKNEAGPEDHISSVCDADGYVLYTTVTCPNCRAVKPLLERSGLCYTERNVDEHIEEASALGLRQAPTLAVRSGDKTVLYTGAAQIKSLLKELAL